MKGIFTAEKIRREIKIFKGARKLFGGPHDWMDANNRIHFRVPTAEPVELLLELAWQSNLLQELLDDLYLRYYGIC
jgi:hypothetical protein